MLVRVTVRLESDGRELSMNSTIFWLSINKIVFSSVELYENDVNFELLITNESSLN